MDAMAWEVVRTGGIFLLGFGGAWIGADRRVTRLNGKIEALYAALKAEADVRKMADGGLDTRLDDCKAMHKMGA